MIETKICRLCEKEFQKKYWNQVFCGWTCRRYYTKLIITKEELRLTDKDRRLRRKILLKRLNQKIKEDENGN